MKDLWIFILVSLLLLWILQRWRHRRHFLLGFKLPTNWWHLITGFGYILTRKVTIKIINEATCKYGSNVVCYFGPYPSLITSDPDTIRDILTAKQSINKPDAFYAGLANSLKRGFITMSDPHWTNERRIVNAAFNNKNLMSFIPIFNEEVNAILKSIDKDIEDKTNTPLITFFREFTLAIASRTTIGRKLHKTSHSGPQFARWFTEFQRFGAECMLNILYVFAPLRDFLEKTYYKKGRDTKVGMLNLINESLNGFHTKRGVDPSYETDINPAIEYMDKGAQQQKMQRQHILDDMFHIFVGAFETTSLTLYFILIMLGMHPEHQERAYEEVCNIFPYDDDEQFEVTYEDIGQMVFIDMIMNETMRVLPIIPQVAREPRERDLTLSSGVVLHKGLCVVLDIFSLHRSKAFWGPEAEKFNPDNFLPDNVEARHPYAFLPFTKGLRFCIGWRYAQLSIKAALAKLIKRYKFTTHCKLEDLVLENHVTSQLRKDPPLTIERREITKSN